MLIRLADAPSLVIAAYRLSLASLILVPLGLARAAPEIRVLSGRQLLFAGLAGIFLALHFAFWITSLDYTSVASSVVLVTINPIFVGIASHFLTSDRLSRQTMAGIAMAVAGAGVISYGDWGIGWRALWGDVLALLGALAVAGYYMMGRRLRHRLSLLAYASLVYLTAALVLLALAVASEGRLEGYSVQTYLMLVLLALVPQLLGHTSLNWALRYVPATLVSTAVLGEPVGATILAYLILGEVPTPPEIGGGALVLVGVYIAFRARPSPAAVG